MFCRPVGAGVETVAVSGCTVWHAPCGADGDAVPCCEKRISWSTLVGAGAVGALDGDGPAGAYGGVQEDDGARTTGRIATSRTTTRPGGVCQPAELECCDRRGLIKTGRAFDEDRRNRP